MRQREKEKKDCKRTRGKKKAKNAKKKKNGQLILLVNLIRLYNFNI